MPVFLVDAVPSIHSARTTVRTANILFGHRLPSRVRCPATNGQSNAVDVRYRRNIVS